MIFFSLYHRQNWESGQGVSSTGVHYSTDVQNRFYPWGTGEQAAIISPSPAGTVDQELDLVTRDVTRDSDVRDITRDSETDFTLDSEQAEVNTT